MEFLFYPIAKNGEDQILVINILALIIGGTLWWWLLMVVSRFLVKKIAVTMRIQNNMELNSQK